VGVHAVAAESVWTRDPNDNPTMRFETPAPKGAAIEVETFWVSARCGGTRRFVTVMQSGWSTALSPTGRRKNGSRRGLTVTSTRHSRVVNGFWNGSSFGSGPWESLIVDSFGRHSGGAPEGTFIHPG